MKKLKKYFSLIKNNINYYLVQIVFFRFMCKFKKDSRKYKKLKIKYIEKNIEKKCKKIIERYDDYSKKYTSDKNNIPKIIWILWWQGIENSPEIVKCCINSIKKNNPEYEINIISENNINNYIQLEEIIVKKFKENKMSFASFSDIIRMNLLSRYGGVWCDATIFMTKGLDNTINTYDFYSINLKSEENNIYVSDLRWVIYFLCSKKENFLMKFVLDVSVEYFKHNDYAIDYFLTDHIIDMAYNRYDFVKKMIDDIPINNTNVEKMVYLLNQQFNDRTFKEISQNTNMFKLSYKLNLAEGDTFYNHLIRKGL